MVVAHEVKDSGRCWSTEFKADNSLKSNDKNIESHVSPVIVTMT